jgi:hypothetical protein
VSVFEYGSEPPPLSGEIGFTAFETANYNVDNSTIVFGFAASPDKTYTVDWGSSWLELDGMQTRLADFAPANTAATDVG